MSATDSKGNVCYLVCSDRALEYVRAEVTDRHMPIGEGVIVGPDALDDARRKVKEHAMWSHHPLRIFALVEVKP
jgi:hypothetical protein